MERSPDKRSWSTCQPTQVKRTGFGERAHFRQPPLQRRIILLQQFARQCCPGKGITIATREAPGGHDVASHAVAQKLAHCITRVLTPWDSFRPQRFCDLGFL
jgi:hypothetical protein